MNPIMIDTMIDTTLEAHEGTDDYDFAFNFDGISHNDLVGMAKAILQYVDGDSSIE